MKKIAALLCGSALFLAMSCSQSGNKVKEPVTDTTDKFNSFKSQAKWGEHLVTVSACHDCHTPKKMTLTGPVIDSSLLLAGHIAGSPEPDANRKEILAKGLVVTNDLTTWIGGWGTSYTANLTSDASGIGNWKEEQFIYAIRQGKLKGLAASRPLLPPMPWEMYKHFTDGELKAIFAYLKTTRPVRNIVPAPVPPGVK